MAVYGDIEYVRKMIRAETTWTTSIDVDDRLEAIQKAVSLVIEESTGRTFGVAVSDTAVLHWVSNDGIIVLNRPARSITSIRYGGTMSGSTMTDGTTVPGADLVNVITSDRDNLVLAIAHTSIFGLSGYASQYSGGVVNKIPVIVTGDFSTSDDDASVPDDITYAANILIAEHWKMEHQSASGAVDQDGVIIPSRNPFNMPIIKRTLDKYAIRCRVHAV